MTAYATLTKFSWKVIKGGVPRLWRRSPIAIVASGPPAVRGRGWHYTTRGGRAIWHPSAYAKVGWSNMVYCGSTREITVGVDWLMALAYRTGRCVIDERDEPVIREVLRQQAVDAGLICSPE